MENKELLLKLNFLIKEINETHNRLQRAKEHFQEVEVALLTQQIVNVYQHLQLLQDDYRKARLQRSFQPESAIKQQDTPKQEEPESRIKESQNIYEIRPQQPQTVIPTPEPEKPKPLTEPVPAQVNEQKKEEPDSQAVKDEFIRREEPVQEKQTQEYAPKTVSQQTPVPETPIESAIITPTPPDQTFEPTPSAKNEPIREPEPQPSPLNEEKQETPLHEKLTTDTRSINERFAQQQVKKNLADKLKLSPIKDLKSAMSLNQRIAFQRNLFQGNEEEYRKAVSFINELKSFSEAKFYVQSEITPKYNWDEENPLVVEFMELVYRKFL